MKDRMADFVRRRGSSLALVVLVMMAIGLAQSSISYTFAFGTLGIPLKLHMTALTTLGALARWGLLMSMAALWLLEKKGALFVLVIVVNTFATLILHPAADLELDQSSPGLAICVLEMPIITSDHWINIPQRSIINPSPLSPPRNRFSPLSKRAFFLPLRLPQVVTCAACVEHRVKRNRETDGPIQVSRLRRKRG
jgi:hypothetical protein